MSEFKIWVSKCCKVKVYPAIPPDIDPTPICSKCHQICECETKEECLHKVTIAINEEGHAGIYCMDCDEQLEKEC